MGQTYDAAKTERLGRAAAVKATVLIAHLGWLKSQLGPAATARLSGLSAEASGLVQCTLLGTDWIPFGILIEIDRAIAHAVEGSAEGVYHALGRHSAVLNLGGVYKSFARDEPHRFLKECALLHRRFQTFGTARYERTGLQSGRLIMEGYPEYSPIYCASGLGYYEGAVKMMGAPGPVECTEGLCQCNGDPACVFDICW